MEAMAGEQRIDMLTWLTMKLQKPGYIQKYINLVHEYHREQSVGYGLIVHLRRTPLFLLFRTGGTPLFLLFLRGL